MRLLACDHVHLSKWQSSSQRPALSPGTQLLANPCGHTKGTLGKCPCLLTHPEVFRWSIPSMFLITQTSQTYVCEHVKARKWIDSALCEMKTELSTATAVNQAFYWHTQQSYPFNSPPVPHFLQSQKTLILPLSWGFLWMFSWRDTCKMIPITMTPKLSQTWI